MQRRPLFNPNGDTDPARKAIIGGNTTNLQEFNSLKYAWAYRWYRVALSNFWVPEEINMAQDLKDYRALTTKERTAFDKIMSFLIFLDSLQTANLPNINDYITAPEVNLCLTVHAFQEAVHSQAYSYILDTVCEPQERWAILYQWKDDAHLLRRVGFIGHLYNEFTEHPSRWQFVKTCMANFVLESVYFYSGFAFFYALERSGKMGATAQEIRYINRDELTHVALFRNIMRELQNENPDLFTPECKEELREMMREAVDHEVAWGRYVISDAVEGLSGGLIEQYIKYLANERLKQLDLVPLYPEAQENPLPWITKYANTNLLKTDFFEARPTAYSHSAMVRDDL